MPLPRPARLVKQYPHLLRRQAIPSPRVRCISSTAPVPSPKGTRKEADLEVDDDVAQLILRRDQLDYERAARDGRFIRTADDGHADRQQAFQDDMRELLQEAENEENGEELEAGPSQNIIQAELHSIGRRIEEADGKRSEVPTSPYGIKPGEPAKGEDFSEPRETRRSPAALIGSKRIGSTLLPPLLIEGITNAIKEVNPQYIRQEFLKLRAQRMKDSTKTKKVKQIEPEMVVAAASAFLPGEYAAVRNIFEELYRRLGHDWLEKAEEAARKTHLSEEDSDGVESMEREVASEEHARSPPRVIEASSGLGPGLWALLDSRGTLPDSAEDSDVRVQGEAARAGPVDYQLFQGSQIMRHFVKELAETIPESAASIEYPPRFDRNFVSTTPAVVMSTFYLSTLQPFRRPNHIKKLLSFKSPYLIIVDHARPQGWAAISKAREAILEHNTEANPLHIVAPCPHEKACPLLNTSDICGFSQRLESPRFLRRTKHSKSGEEDKGYVYLVVARGKRPATMEKMQEEIAKAGFAGGVAKEEAARRAQAEMAALQELEGGAEGEQQAEKVLSIGTSASTRFEGESGEAKEEAPQHAISQPRLVQPEEVLKHIRTEAYSWPRLVAPPFKKGKHVTFDACSPSGQIERMTVPQSHSRQGYYDARKAFWGDLFPHKPKGQIVPRPRGVKRLVPSSLNPASEEEAQEWMEEIFGEEDEEDKAETEALKQMGVRIKYNVKSEGTTWKSREEREDEKKLERARAGAMYKVEKVDRFDGFPYDDKVYSGPAHSPKAERQGKKLKKPKKAKKVVEADEHDLVSPAEEKVAEEPKQTEAEALAAFERGIMAEFGGNIDPKLAKWLQGEGRRGEVVHTEEAHSFQDLRRIRQKIEDESRRQSGIPSIGQKRSYGTWAAARVGLGLSASLTQRRFMSARPVDRSTGNRSKVTLAELARMKATGKPITTLTAYDFPTALLSESTGVDITLVGDSLSQVALGHDSTTQITLDEMLHHSKAVTRGAKTPFIVADLPFGSFEASVEKGVESAIRLIKEGGVDGLKIEGGREILPLVKRLSDVGIVVMPHVGLQPQRATSMSGYLVQGRSAQSAQYLLDTVLELEQAGAAMFLLEAIPHMLGEHITQQLRVPTIGIGAGPGTSGQVLVITDVMGTYAPEPVSGEDGEIVRNPAQPRFVRQFGNVGRESSRAVSEYLKSVRDGSFPEIGKETYGMKKEEWEAFVGGPKGNDGDM